MNRTAAAIGFVAVLLAALITVLVIDGGDDPVAAPTTTAPPTSSAPQSTTSPTTTTTPPTTTAPPADREAEIEEIMTFVELRMWQAVEAGDIELLGTLLGDPFNYEPLAEAAGDSGRYFSQSPSTSNFELRVDEILLDREDCLVARVTEDPRPFLVDGQVDTLIAVLWPRLE
ncbi:MAG TPA: hypothetical protein VGC47_12665, partial [Acidimicrobiia bacterium]